MLRVRWIQYDFSDLLDVGGKFLDEMPLNAI
jgi:hypothetical protein